MSEDGGKTFLVRLAPSEPGLGGITRGLHGFLGVNTTRLVSGAHVFRRSWRRDETFLFGWTLPYTAEWRALRFWEKPSGIPGVQPSSIGAGVAILWDGGSARWYARFFALTSTPAQVYEDWQARAALYPPNPGILIEGDRMLVWTGLGRARLWTGAGYPTGPYPLPSYLGVPSPQVPPSLTIEYNWEGDYYYGMEGAPYASRPSVAASAVWDGLSVGELVRVKHTTLGAPGYVERRILSVSSGVTTSADPTSGPHAFRSIKAIATCDGTSGDDEVTVNCTMPADADGVCRRFIGLDMHIFGQSDVVRMITNAVIAGSGTTLTLSANLSAAAVSANFQIRGVRLELDDDLPADSVVYETAGNELERSAADPDFPVSWSGADAPGIAYAYYDPVTGHVSNLSPIAYPEDDQAFNVKLTVDKTQNSGWLCANGDTPVSGLQTATGLQYVGEYSSVEALRFTKILFFRTRRRGGGAILYPLGSLDPASGDWLGISGSPTTATGTWTDTSADDTALIVSGRVRAPLTTNHPPRIVTNTGASAHLIFAGLASWDGRLWGFGEPDPVALRCSCDRAQCGMGRPEESWPDGNRYPIPAEDGTLTHIMVVGETLVVFTAGATYRVVGNHETNYRLMQISTEMPGLGPRDVCAVPSPGGGSALIAARTKDNRILLVVPGEAGVDIGEAMSFETAATKDMTFVRRGGRPRLLVTIGDVSSYPGRVYEYDLAYRVWTLNNPVLDVPTVGLTATPYIDMTYASPQGVAADTEPTLFVTTGESVYLTQPASPRAAGQEIASWAYPTDGEQRILSFVSAHVVMASAANLAGVAAPTLWVSVGDVSGSSVEYRFNMVAPPDALRSYFGGTTGLDGYVKEWVAYAPAALLNGVAVGRLPLGRRLSFRLVPSVGDTVDYRILFLDIRLRDEGGLEP